MSPAKTSGRAHRAQLELSLKGQLLMAMPAMPDPRFAKTVIYLCAHDASGAMGIIINRLFGELDFPALLSQLDITPAAQLPDVRVHFGGPVETGRGFVLHTSDHQEENTTLISPQVGLTATVDMLRMLAAGRGPAMSLVALGYAGWAAGQLEQEIQANGWLTAPADPQILFDADLDGKWDRALARIGVSAHRLAEEAGHA